MQRTPLRSEEFYDIIKKRGDNLLTIKYLGAQGRTRTGTKFPSKDFKSFASAIPPLGQNKLYHFRPLSVEIVKLSNVTEQSEYSAICLVGKQWRHHPDSNWG